MEGFKFFGGDENISPYRLWEMKQKSFKNMMERQQKEYENKKIEEED